LNWPQSATSEASTEKCAKLTLTFLTAFGAEPSWVGFGAASSFRADPGGGASSDGDAFADRILDLTSGFFIGSFVGKI
jgi:hypothetical protein